MERDIVLRHELIELNVVWIQPPLSPLWGVARGNGEVTGRGRGREQGVRGREGRGREVRGKEVRGREVRGEGGERGREGRGRVRERWGGVREGGVRGEGESE